VSISQKDPTKSSRAASLLNEEQRLCNDALESRAFDAISDDEWVAMCERVAADARHDDVEDVD